MAEFKSASNYSEQINKIKGQIGTINTINGFIGSQYLSDYLNSNNEGNPNILKVLSDILITLVGSQEKLKTVLVDILTNNLSSLETSIKEKIKQATTQLISCGLDAKLNVPLGVIDQSVLTIPEQYPYVDQYDFYGLFTKNINDPIQNLQFDRNLNTFIKTNIDSQTQSFTWQDKSGTDVVKFTYDETQERIKVGPPNGSDWGPTGIGVKEFIDLYLNSINIFPTESILKDLLDTILDIKENNPYSVDLDFLLKLLSRQSKCKTIEDDRSKSTFDLSYNDFINTPIKENEITTTTNIKFGPVDAPIPNTIIPVQPNLDESYLNTVSTLSKNEFIMGNRNNRSQAVNDAIDKAGETKNTQNNAFNSPLNTKFALKPNLEMDMNLKMILMLPTVLVMPLFSPKIAIYFGIIYKRYYIGDNPARDLWKDKDEYYEFMAKLIETIMRELVAYLLKKIFEIIKREVIRLIIKIIARVLGDKIIGYVNQLKSLIELFNALKGKIPPKLPKINYNNCKSVLDNLLQLFEIPNIPPGIPLPPGMSMMGMTKTGLSPTLITQSAVRKMNSLGLNTTAMVDGSPNPNVVIANAIASAVVEQLQNNARIQVSTVGLGYSEGGGTIT